MQRTDIINHLIRNNDYKTYLEIGVFHPKRNFKKIKCRVKEGVDPNGCSDYTMTSDAFFARIDPEKKYDLIFIDGLHEEHQVDKDIQNSLQHLSKYGTIVMHDCNPPTEWHQRPPGDFKEGEPWNGTTWKSYAKLRMNRNDLMMRVVDTDWGVGIIQFGDQKCFTNRPVEYSILEENRKELLNLISAEEFLKIY